MLFGKVIGSLPGERKHRDAKVFGRWAFKNPELTMLRGILNALVHDIKTDTFEAVAMIDPKLKTIGGFMQATVSASARLPCGEVRRGFVVLCRDNLVGEVMSFIAQPSSSGGAHEVVVQLQSYMPAEVSDTFRLEGPVLFLDAHLVLAPLPWAVERRGVVRVILPALP